MCETLFSKQGKGSACGLSHDRWHSIEPTSDAMGRMATCHSDSRFLPPRCVGAERAATLDVAEDGLDEA